MRRIPTILFFCAALTAGSVLAQSSNASLAGAVLDQQGAAIAGAKVSPLDASKGQKREARTSASGEFHFAQLGPSTYELLVEQPGFAKTRVAAVVLNASDQRSIQVTLQIARTEDAVTVLAEAPLVAAAPSVATTVNRTFIENQPLNGRTFQTLINLSPGVVLAPASLVDQGQFSVNGQRTGTNYFTVDGVSANFGLPAATSPYEGSGGGVPSFSTQGGTSGLASVDAVQEFTIQTSHVFAGIRTPTGRAGGHRHQIGHQQSPRLGIRVPSQ